jgi:hypothetical protein
MWEHGFRGRRAAASLETAEAIVGSLGLPGEQSRALADLWQSADSDEALPPRTVWCHNFRGPSGPAWAWLRPEAGQDGMTARLWWGLAAERPAESSASPGGVLIQFPATVPNPALEVALSCRGWADFGGGVVPSRIAADLGIRLVMARDLVLEGALPGRPATGGGSVPRPFAEQVRTALFVPQARSPQSRRVPSASAGPGTRSAVPPPRLSTDSRGILVSQFRMRGGEIQRLREARGLGRDAAAAVVTSLDPRKRITSRMLETIESGGRPSDGNSIIARLDMTYRTDGHLGIERTFISRPQAAGATVEIAASFPDFWYGPVWLRFTGRDPAEAVPVRLAWGHWRWERQVRSGTVVATRRAPVAVTPLRARLPPGWFIAAGTGVVPGALDINRDWRAAGVPAARALLRAFTESVGHS